MGMIERSGKGRRSGSSLAGALVMVVVATAGGGRVGAAAGERPGIRRAVPEVVYKSAKAPAPENVPLLAREHPVNLAGTWAERLQLGHFLSPAMRRSVRYVNVTAASQAEPTVTPRNTAIPAFPGLPDLVLVTPLLVPGRGGNPRGELRTGLSEVVDGSGALLGVLGRTLFTSPDIVESQPFLMNAQGEVRPLTMAQYREALRQHDTLLIGDDPLAFSRLVETMHFPAAEIPAEYWFALGASPTAWWGEKVRRVALTERRGTVAGKKGKQARIRGLDGGEIVIPLRPGAVELRTRLVERPQGDGAASTPFAGLPTLMDWRFVLDPSPTAGALLIPLPATGVGIATVSSDGYPSSDPADDFARHRDRTASGAPSGAPTLRADEVKTLLTGRAW